MIVRLKQHGKAERGHIILAHGAGAGMDSDFMQFAASGLAAAGYEAILFNFPYMEKRIADGGRRPPDRAPKLLDHFRTVIAQVKAGIKDPGRPLLIGGKSMGGRMASMIAAETPDIANGLIVFGYPFHPPGKPEKLGPRTDHFSSILMPALLVQGERDTFGGIDLIRGLDLPKSFEVQWAPDGDHSFKPRKKSGHTQPENWAAAIKAVTNKNWNTVHST